MGALPNAKQKTRKFYALLTKVCDGNKRKPALSQRQLPFVRKIMTNLFYKSLDYQLLKMPVGRSIGNV